MKILNIHRRIIGQSAEHLAQLLPTLSTKKDRIFPFEKWPSMRFKQGLKVGSHGGHGPVRYTVKRIVPKYLVEFEFTKPDGFIGTHTFEITKIDRNSSELKHTIAMHTEGFLATFKWLFAVRALHDALLEDALDKVENQFSVKQKISSWSLWVRVLRSFLK